MYAVRHLRSRSVISNKASGWSAIQAPASRAPFLASSEIHSPMSIGTRSMDVIVPERRKAVSNNALAAVFLICVTVLVALGMACCTFAR